MSGIQFRAAAPAPGISQALFLIMAVIISACSRQPNPPNSATGPRASGALQQEAYVWQRAWTPAVASGVKSAKGKVGGIAVLAAEVEWLGNTPRLIKARLDYSALKEMAAPVSLALRIGPWGGPYAENDERAGRLAGWAQEILKEARDAGVEPSELQIDFDAATSQLAGYQAWLRVFRKAATPLPVSFTALPDWLNSPVLQTMAKETGRFVLQVHAVERARMNDTPPLLIHADTARRWVERAGALGVPFRVALPTYRSVVGFNADGKIAGIDSEGPARAWPRGMHVVTYRSPAADLAKLVTGWTADRPAAMRGVLWYRLPVPGESRNWTWATLSSVMSGRAPAEKLDATATAKNPADLAISNTGEAEMTWPESVTVRIDPGHGRIVAGDAIGGYALDFDAAQPDKAVFRRSAAAFDHYLPPGGKKPLGWLRLDSDTAAHELRVSIP